MLVHDRGAELKFISEGYGVDRRQIAWNDFVVVGPDQDPARIKGGHDAVAAFKAIAGAKAPFVSRGDNSGTNALELRLWKSTAIEPKEGAGSWVPRHRRRHGHGKERLEEARRLADWLVSQEGQQAIGGYEIHSEQLFHPSAAPK